MNLRFLWRKLSHRTVTVSKYVVLFGEKAANDYKQVASIYKRSVARAIESFAENPFPGDEEHLETIENTLYYQLLRGPYWIIYGVDDNKRTVTIRNISWINFTLYQ